MKESTIITNFNVLNNKYEKLTDLTQKNFQQLYMISTAMSMTINALSSLLIEKGLMTQEDIKSYIEKEQDKRSGKSIAVKEDNLKSQPVFNSEAGIDVSEG